jgi:hypothetical protein
MDNTDAHRDEYLAGHASLEGRVLFVSADPGTPAAAFLKLNDPLGAEGERIRAVVRDGYIVRTRADEPGVEARTGDTRRRDAAFLSRARSARGMWRGSQARRGSWRGATPCLPRPAVATPGSSRGDRPSRARRRRHS